MEDVVHNDSADEDDVDHEDDSGSCRGGKCSATEYRVDEKEKEPVIDHDDL